MINDTRTRTDEATSLPRLLSLSVHELRTPVTVVAGYIRMLLREQGGPLNDKQRKMLEEADRSCGRIATLVAEMSELGKLEAQELTLTHTTFDLVSAATDAASGLDDHDRGVTVEARGTGELLVTGDRARTVAAIRALVHSAVRERIHPGVVVASCTGEGPWGVVAIGDDAVTQTPDSAALGEGPAFDEWRGGMGLSLPVARRVVEAQGGMIWTAGDGPGRVSGLKLPLLR